MNSKFDTEEENLFSKRSPSSFSTSNKNNSVSKFQENFNLSLRRKRKEKSFSNIKITQPYELKYEINISEITPQIQNEPLYLEYNKLKSQINPNEKEVLFLCLKMLLSENILILKFSLYNIKEYLIYSVEEEKVFEEKRLTEVFNKEMFYHLFSLLDKYSFNNFLISNILFIISKLCGLSNNYHELVANNISLLFKVYPNISENNVKNLLFLVFNHVFQCSNDILKQIEKNYANIVDTFYQELFLININNISKNPYFLSTLLQIFENMFINGIYIPYLFSYDNSTNGKIEIRAINIINHIKQFLKYSFDKEIFKQEIFCINDFLSFYSNEVFDGNKEEEENNKNQSKENFNSLYLNLTISKKELKSKIKSLIKSLDFENIIIPCIFDNSKDDGDVRKGVLKILINTTKICSLNFCLYLIEKGKISQQLTKLQNYLIQTCNITNNKNKNKNLYKLHIHLIYNLLYSQNKTIIDDLCTENMVIANLFLLKKKYETDKEIQHYFIGMFDCIIKSQSDFGLFFLLIEKEFFELYKEVLDNSANCEDNENEEDVEAILENLIELIKYGKDLAKNDRNDEEHILSGYLENIGLIDSVNNLRNNENISEEINNYVDELITLIKN